VVAGVVPDAALNRALEVVAWGGVIAGLVFGYLSGWQYLRAFVAAYERTGRVS
jgi:hypothetical protein